MELKQREYVDIDINLKRPTDVYLTNRIGGIIFVFVGMVFLIIFFQAVSLIGLLIPILLLLFILRQFIDIQPLGPLIEVRRELSRPRVVESDDIEIKFFIKNLSLFSTHIIELQDKLMPEFEIIEGTNAFSFSLSPKQQIVLKYKVKCHYIGRYAFNLINIRHQDFFKLTSNEFFLSDDIMPGLAKSLEVVPKLEKIEKLPVFSKWMRLYNGFFATKFQGDDADFRGIREFTYGDNIRRVNWKTSARFQNTIKNSLYSNSFNWDKALESELILDTTYSVFPVWIQCLRAVVSLGEFLIRGRNKVGLTLLNQYPEHFRPLIGKKQLKNITEKLLMIEPEKISNVDMLNLRLEVIMKKFSPQALIIIISPFLNKSIIDFAIKLRHQNFNLIAITPLAFEKQIQEISTGSRDYAYETPIIHELITANLIIDQITIDNKLKNHRIPQIKWNTLFPLSTPLFHTRMDQRNR